jgi:hypothetical protein
VIKNTAKSTQITHSIERHDVSDILFSTCYFIMYFYFEVLALIEK